jgi:uncharacterized repeat protein (TIGR01451 family)
MEEEMRNLKISHAWRAGLGAIAAMLLIPAAAQAADADLAVTTGDSPDPVKVGEQVLYAVNVTNNGPGDIAKATLTDKLSSQLTFVSATATQGTCKHQGNKVTCDLGALSATDEVTVRIKATAKKAGKATSTATVEVGKPDTDPTAGNDTDTETTTVTEPQEQKVFCNGMKATIVGTPGSDTLLGTAKRDVIQAGGGGDVVRGLSNDDVVCAGRGGDIVRGGGDSDLLKGGSGDDLLKGGSGDDALIGGLGDDTCRGGAGTDTKKGC